MFVYLAANHFPWDYRWRPELTPEWKGLGNKPIVDEYLRRQMIGMQDYADFLARLKRDFPDESFLIVRYGDHQPDFSSRHPRARSSTTPTIAKRIAIHDPRYFTTYYAIDAVNFKPADIAVRAQDHRGPVSAAGRAGECRPAARFLVRGAEEDPAALQRAVLQLQWRRRGAAFQSAC